jgi:hypothetical protein
MVNSEKDFSEEGKDFDKFSKNIYKHFKLDYPKFYKMDNLCKLGFLASELLLRKTNIINAYKGNEIGVVLANSASSIDADINHYNTIKDPGNYFPSPSIFVYTLPNIVIGEICIKNKITSEGNFFIQQQFDADLITAYISNLINLGKIEACIGGWIEYTPASYDALLFTIEKKNSKNCENQKGSITFEQNTLTSVYQTLL